MDASEARTETIVRRPAAVQRTWAGSYDEYILHLSKRLLAHARVPHAGRPSKRAKMATSYSLSLSVAIAT